MFVRHLFLRSLLNYKVPKGFELMLIEFYLLTPIEHPLDGFTILNFSTLTRDPC
jgi:hypothetical protein